MTFPPVDRIYHAYIKTFFVFVQKKIANVTNFGLHSRKSLRKANSLLRYFRAFWLQSGIADVLLIPEVYIKGCLLEDFLRPEFLFRQVVFH